MMELESLRTQLDQLNKEVASLLDEEPAPLSFHEGKAEEDPLYLYGIVGGKDVGKTTLINQLAGSRISIDTDVLDEGTKTIIAYCHEADIPALNKRIAQEAPNRMNIASHNRNELRNVVLIDFPDFDSRFATHREDMRRFSKRLQGMVWVITPRKYGDHEFIDQLNSIAQSNENYTIVLNKIDQIEKQNDLESIREEVTQYIARECSKRNLPAPNWDRFFMVSALQPERHHFRDLQNRLIRVHSPEEIAKAKLQNLRAEFDRNIDRMRSSYALDKRIAELDGALECISQAVYEQFPEEYFETVRRRIICLQNSRQRISRNLFLQRVEGWPILRNLSYPLSGIISLLGGTVRFRE